MTQGDRVIKYLETHDSISPMEAFEELGITKLATVVSDLIRNHGMSIRKEYRESINRYGEKCYYMRYSLED